MQVKARLPKYKQGDIYSCLDDLCAATKHVENPGWASQLLGIPRIWKRTQGEGVRVAILDTGIDSTHPDLKGAVVSSKNFSSNSPQVIDKAGHGTHVAGIIAARRNRSGFVGVAPKASLLIAKVLGDDGSGSFDGIVNGINWAVAQKADIINMSLGGPISTPNFYTAIHNALTKGVFIVVAAGNEGALGVNTVGYPGRYGSVITIGSHDRNGNPSGFSSRGGEIDFLAPGDKIISTYPGGSFREMSGTSMASPWVTGLAALIIGRNKKLRKPTLKNNEQLREEFRLLASHPGHYDPVTGYGPLLPMRGLI